MIPKNEVLHLTIMLLRFSFICVSETGSGSSNTVKRPTIDK